VKLSSFAAICESPEIWTDLTRDPTVTGVQNIPWGEIESIAATQIQQYEYNISVQKASLDQLEPRIADAVAKEKLPAADPAEVDALITGAILSFAGAEKAREAGCGKPGSKTNRTIRGAYKKSVEQMAADAPPFFKGGKSLDGLLFLGRCKELLGEDGWCRNLCQELKDEAAGHATTPGMTESSALIKEKEALNQELMDITEKLSQCQEALGALLGFKKEISERKALVNKRFGDYRSAEEALEDAQYDLDDLGDLMTEKKEGLEKTLKELDAANTEVATATACLEDLQREETELKGKVEATTKAFGTLQEQFFATRTADGVIEKLKDVVSRTTLKMRLFFQEAALEPVQANGLSVDTRLCKYFSKDITQLRAAGELDNAVDALDNFCRKEAMPAFKAVQDLDVSSLCAIGEVADVKKGMYDTVQSRITESRELIENVGSWMSPYKGQEKMTAEIARERVAAGEPKGLREVVGVYRNAQFFQYLQGWEYQGKFLALIARLKEISKALSQSMDNMQEQLDEMKEKFKLAMQAREEAEGRLKAAKSAQGVTNSQKADLDREIAELSDQTAKAQKKYDHLKEQVDKAFEEYEKAQKQLLEAHKEGTSFLQALEAGERAADLKHTAELLGLRSMKSALQEELAFAREEYEAIEKQLASLKMD